MSRPESVQRAIDVRVRQALVEVDALERGPSKQRFWRFFRRRAIRKELTGARQRQRESDTLDYGE